jgi:hypothetical protein
MYETDLLKPHCYKAVHIRHPHLNAQHLLLAGSKAMQLTNGNLPAQVISCNSAATLPHFASHTRFKARTPAVKVNRRYTTSYTAFICRSTR